MVESKPVVSVAVRDLVDFVLRTGDLVGESDFVGRDRALAGTRGHQRVQRGRPEGYQREVRVTSDLDGGEFTLRLQGRIDGLISTESELLLEEIKTVQGAWDECADDLHWAQLRIYAALYARDQTRLQITLRLVYLRLESEETKEFVQRVSVSELLRFFDRTTAIYLEWIREQQRWGRQRNQSVQALGFPFAAYRPGQRAIAVATYRAVSRQQRLFVEAPTGIGKTVSVLFPILKALAEGRIKRAFYLTARTTARAVAEKAMADLRRSGLRARSLTLTAKEKVCVQQGQPCDPRLCPFTRGYYDRRGPAIRAALAVEEINRPVLERIALEFQVCPFELSLDISSWVDVVICDYNYAFDPQVYLRRHFGEGGPEIALLVDEAHNLVDRAREMFSAEIDAQQIHEVKQAIRTAVPRCAKALTKLISALRKHCGPALPPSEFPGSSEPPSDLELFQTGGPAPTAPETEPLPDVVSGMIEARDGVRVWREAPPDLAPLVEAAIGHAERWLARNEAAEFRPDLLELYFRLLGLARVLDHYDERYRTVLEPGRFPRLRLFCLDPSERLRQACARATSATFFSATLSPIRYYRELLGGTDDDPVLQLPSPFPVENLAVLLQDRIRTQFNSRAATLAQVADSVRLFTAARRGHYLVYLPSYQYLDALLARFREMNPPVTILVQRPGMSESERDAFLAAFETEPTQTQVGFAVLGGVFGEGVDLVGDRLIGAVIVGVGLPQLCAERDLIRDYFEEKTGAGFEYAYTFPGMNRVLQAIGRVIRSEVDRGAVLLVDTRYAELRYRQLFPAHWNPIPVRTVEQIEAALRRFWMNSNTVAP